MEEGKKVEGVDLAAELELARVARQELEDKNAVLSIERDNYKLVALKRKGKLENDEDFFGQHDEKDVEAQVSREVALSQKERDVQRQIAAEKEARQKAEKKASELQLAIENQSKGAVGGGASGGGQEVKDAVFSETQLNEMNARWQKMGFDEAARTRMMDAEKRKALAKK